MGLDVRAVAAVSELWLPRRYLLMCQIYLAAGPTMVGASPNGNQVGAYCSRGCPFQQRLAETDDRDCFAAAVFMPT